MANIKLTKLPDENGVFEVMIGTKTVKGVIPVGMEGQPDNAIKAFIKGLEENPDSAMTPKYEKKARVFEEVTLTV